MTDSGKHPPFWESLDRWHQVIEHLVRKGRAPRGITEDAYFRLHHDLLEQVRPSANESMPTDHLRESLHHSVRPWVNLDSLTHCDKRVLRMLEQEVRLIRDKSMPRNYWHRQIIQRLAAAVIVLAALVIMIGLFSSGSLQEVWRNAQGVRAQFWHGIIRSSANQRLILLAGAMVLVGMFFLRTPKSS